LVNAPPDTVFKAAAVLVVVGNEVLVTQEAGGMWKGMWGCPGGDKEVRDMTVIDTAVRELWEEVGIRWDPGHQSLLFTHDARHQDGKWTKFFVVRFLQKPAISLQDGEISSYRWVDFGERLQNMRPGFPHPYISIMQELRNL
jgi:8-oxo-dGTP pyrophosphatase MutT (NUDIX family)